MLAVLALIMVVKRLRYDDRPVNNYHPAQLPRLDVIRRHVGFLERLWSANKKPTGEPWYHGAASLPKQSRRTLGCSRNLAFPFGNRYNHTLAAAFLIRYQIREIFEHLCLSWSVCVSRSFFGRLRTTPRATIIGCLPYLTFSTITIISGERLRDTARYKFEWLGDCLRR